MECSSIVHILVGLVNVYPAQRYASAGISRLRVSVCLSFCLSHVGIVSQWVNVGSRKQRHVIAQGFIGG